MCNDDHFAEVLCSTSGNGPGPIRNKGRGAVRAAPKEHRKPKNTPKTAAELDQELDSFMKDDAAAPITEDVEMTA
jgi:hypothetical protein